MESYTDFNGFGYFYDNSQPQRGQPYEESNGGWDSYQIFDTTLDSLNLNGFRPDSVFEAVNGTSLSSFTYPNGFQPSSYAVPGDTGNYYPNPAWTPTSHEATGAPYWPLASEVAMIQTNLHQEAGNDVGMFQSQSVITFIPAYDIQPTPIASPSSVVFQPMASEHLWSPIYAPQQEFGTLPSGEMNLLNSVSPSQYLQKQRRNKPAAKRWNKPPTTEPNQTRKKDVGIVLQHPPLQPPEGLRAKGGSRTPPGDTAQTTILEEAVPMPLARLQSQGL